MKTEKPAYPAHAVKRTPDRQKDIQEDRVYNDLVQAAACEKAQGHQGPVRQALKTAFRHLHDGVMIQPAHGDRVIARLAAGTGSILAALYRARYGNAGEDFAICAAGGFGRAEMAPRSDIDLLFLHDPSISNSALTERLNGFLYPLWDSNLKLGYAVHTPESAVAFASDNLTAHTAYLDARLICGNRSLFHDFHNAYDNMRNRTKERFIGEVLEEQDRRQARADETRYLVEPDIKEGKGGLRDLQTIGWIYKYAYGTSPYRDTGRVFGQRERRMLSRIRRFFWSVRICLHDIKGYADENLSFDIQPAVADRLGYARRTGTRAAERLMKHYFVNAAEVGRLTRILCARMEEEHICRKTVTAGKPPDTLEDGTIPGEENLCLHAGRLDFRDRKKAGSDPRDFFRLFRIYGQYPSVDLHPDALETVSKTPRKDIAALRGDRTAGQLFSAILTRSARTARVLRIMTETGLLQKYIPVFGSITGRVDYGLYRRYTLDEHVLRCIDMLDSIRRGEQKKAHPIATRILKKTADPVMFYLGILLHESIWTLKEYSPSACEKLVRRVLAGLGQNREDAATAGYAVAFYRDMIRTAACRNLADTQATSFFAKTVENPARLDLMLVISVCHLRTVNLRSWDGVTRRQLATLHQGACVWFEGGDRALRERVEKRGRKARAQIPDRLAGWDENRRNRALSILTNEILTTLGPERVTRLVRLADSVHTDGTACGVTITPYDGDIEILVYAGDRPGLFAALAGTLAGHGMEVRAVRALETGNGKIADIFIVRDTKSRAPEEPDRNTGQLRDRLLAAAGGTERTAIRPPRIAGDRRAIFRIRSEVRIIRHDAQDTVIAEAEGLDRPGLLYDLALALVQCDVTIASAHIATYGERAVDAFYLRPQNGTGPVLPHVLAHIERNLLKTLDASL